MSYRKSLGALMVLFLVFIFAGPAFSLDAEEEAKFDAIMAMTLDELGEASASLLASKYPETDWGSYEFPDYVFVDQATEMAYKIAVKRPRLLGLANIQDEAAVVPCYCTCDQFGHDNLLYCFYKDGDLTGDFDEHGSQCAVCVRQALLTYLWDDLGATHAEIMEGMKKKFKPLIEKYHSHPAASD